VKTSLRAFCLTFVVMATGCQTTRPSMTASPQLKQAHLDGAIVNYLEQGQGETVIFVHGSFADHRIWEGQRTAVAPRYRYIAIDQRYFGMAPWSDSGNRFSVATHANDMAMFIERIGAGPVHLVGWSYGGTVLLVLAAQRPDLVKSLFLYEPALGSVVSDPADRKAIADDRNGLAPAVAASKGTIRKRRFSSSRTGFLASQVASINCRPPFAKLI
jgi:pimeloyl-ACP methyl ester carboxylesterase